MLFSCRTIVLGGCLAALSLLSTATAQLKILPLGDSITRGEVGSALYESPRGGYRWRLEDRLQSASFNFDFVGSRSDFGWADDGDHEGWGGRRIADLIVIAQDNTHAINADYVLLMVGTNDILATGWQDMEILYTNLWSLVNTIMNQNLDCKLILSTIPNRILGTDPPGGFEWTGILEGEVEAYNSEVVDAIVEDLGWRGVTKVDGNAYIGLNLDDGLHPDQFGEQSLGDAWFDGFQRDFWDLKYRASGNSDGWWTSPYFGTYFDQDNDGSETWVYRDGLNWVYGRPSATGATWFYSPALENWLYWSKDTGDWMYSALHSEWVYTSRNSSPNFWIFLNGSWQSF